MAGSAVVLALTLGSSAWTPLQPAVPRTTQRASIPHAHLACSRRAAFALPLAAITWPVAAHAADKEAALLADLKAVRVALEPLPALLDEEKWDAVRSVLKTPPVGNLWNLGESKNTIRKLAELRDDVELFELADDVAGSLQLADQFTYDNNFIYYQPGNGKVKIKEPKDQIVVASKKIGELLSGS
mmetsp:Transcript_11508/g.29474  ORF Transcript_11508/g.29474 Transcript_11508/m.29474 type:complete len:185 (-) Transcript_11508:281-835(-)